MKKIVKLLAFTLAFTALFVFTSTVHAQVENIDGVDVACVSSFGRVSYEGKARTAFKTLDDAMKALTYGGRIVLQGNSAIDGFSTVKDTEIVGIGTKATGNKITINTKTAALTSNLTLANVTIVMPENGFIVTNGNDFCTTDSFDSYWTEQYNANGANTITYAAPISVSAGNFAKNSEISLLSGKYNTIGAGNGSGTLRVVLDSVIADKVVVGNIDSATDIKGNLIFEFYDSKISEITATSGKIDGNLIVRFSGACDISKIDFSSLPEVSGKKVLVTDSANSYTNDIFDIHIDLASGNVSPAMENGALSGFRFSDKNALGTKKILLSGVETTSDNGIFVLQNGSYEITPVSTIDIALRAESNYVTGYEDGSFLPQNNMTRAEAITILSRLIADEASFKGTMSASFSDVPESAWFSSYIGLFEKLGFLDTISENSMILPNEKITRGEFCELIYKAYSIISERLSGTKEFSDVSTKYKYHDAVSFAGFMGIVGGYEDGTFRPDNLVTRAEVVTMINRMIGRVPAENDVTVFPDTEGHWAKGQINAAANPKIKDGVTMWATKSTNKFDEYMQYRGTLLNSSLTLKYQKKLNVAFIGGSITAGSGVGSGQTETHSWRAKTIEYLKNAFPDCTINQINAAIGDSYTKYAVYRMDNDLLKYNYDLVFIEYAINDSPWYSAKENFETIIYFETLVRRIYEHNPNADIVIVYTIDDKIDATPAYFPTAAAQEIIAKHYDIPSVNFGRALVDYMKDEGKKWGDYFSDYVHPNNDGHLFYAAVLSEFLENAMVDISTTKDAYLAHELPEKHTKKELWYDLTMLEAWQIDLSLSKNWVLSKDGKKIYPTDDDNELIIKTYGSDICIASPRDDEMYYSVDGGAEQYMKMNRKPQTLFDNLSDGEHTLKIRAKDIKNLEIQRVMYNGKAPVATSAKSAGDVLILGDSYSTFEGGIPKGYINWYSDDEQNTDVRHIKDTWWHSFITETNSRLALNSSYSGSTICNTGYNASDSTRSSFITRTDELIEQGFFEINTIDTILIFGATNDSWAGSPIGQMKYSDWTADDLKSFRPALCYLLSQLKENAKGARIIYMVNTGLSGTITSSIKAACEYYGVEMLVLSDFAKQDGHPNMAGMESVKNQLIAYLEK